MVFHNSELILDLLSVIMIQRNIYGLCNVIFRD